MTERPSNGKITKKSLMNRILMITLNDTMTRQSLVTPM